MECKRGAGRGKDGKAQMKLWYQPQEGLYIQIHPSGAPEPACHHTIG